MQGRPPTNTPIFLVNNEVLVSNAEKASALVQHYQKVSSEEGYSETFIAKTIKTKNEFPVWLQSLTEEKTHKYNAPFSLFELESVLLTCKNGAPGDDYIHFKILYSLQCPC